MSERKDFMEQFMVEHFTVYVEREKVMSMTLGKWSSLELMVSEAKAYLNEILAGEQKQVSSYYLNVDKNELRFYTCSLREDWWLL